MFENRLRVLLVLLGVFTLAIVVRLVDLQLVRAGQYREQVTDRMTPPPQWFPFVRGRILDRTGEPLVQDSATWELCVDYNIIAFDKYRERLTKWWSRRERYRGGWLGLTLQGPEEGISALRLRIEQRLHLRIAEMWRDIKVFAQVHHLDDPATIVERAEWSVERVEKIRNSRIRYRGYGEDKNKREIVVREENGTHPIVKGLDQEQQVLARERFRGCPWVEIRPSSERTYATDTTPFAHVLGRVGLVAEISERNDSNSEEALSEYRPSDIHGVSGVEYVAEQRLRGSRGRLLKDQPQKTKYDAAKRGEDVSLTISAELQRALYDLLQEAKMPDLKPVRPGAIVVLDVPTREVLALVSYPSYDPSSFSEIYGDLREDTINMPLRFRAVADRHAPGSILKPLVGLCGLSWGVIDLSTRFTCSGVMDPAHPKRDRCWELRGTGGERNQHGPVNLEEAIRGSCNIFMFHVGDLIGDVDAMCGHFELFGLGACSGTGLLEESGGINPTSGYLARIGRPVVPAHLRQFSIGQGEISVTPVQAANVMATYASGRFKPVTLIRGNATPEETLPGSHAHWSTIRQGMYDVVNDPDGTAYKHARLEHDRYVLCGKTGSATVFAQPILYEIAYQRKGDEAVYFQDVRERAAYPAIDAFEHEHEDDDVAVTVLRDQVKAVEWWPHLESWEKREETRFAHAWFGAFLQARGADGGPDFSVPPRIAFAVLVEYGGSGASVSGPLAKQVAATILDEFGPDLEY